MQATENKPTIYQHNATAESIVLNHIEGILDDMDDSDLISLYSEAHSYDGSFDSFDTFDIEDVASMLEPYELARAIIYGNVTNVIDQVRFNGYGNLESVSDYDLAKDAHDQVDELAYWIRVNGTSDLYFYDSEIEEEINHSLDILDRANEDHALAICKMFANVI